MNSSTAAVSVWLVRPDCLYTQSSTASSKCIPIEIWWPATQTDGERAMEYSWKLKIAPVHHCCSAIRERICSIHWKIIPIKRTYSKAFWQTKYSSIAEINTHTAPLSDRALFLANLVFEPRHQCFKEYMSDKIRAERSHYCYSERRWWGLLSEVV